ncbi:MAG: ATP-binding protein, partial [Chloroflexi bacterium]|nr:ATP-binding protein [Chloroflexota bacterium]
AVAILGAELSLSYLSEFPGPPQIVGSPTADYVSDFGVTLWDDNIRTIASSLLLQKDDLTNRLSSIKSDLLMPPEASLPIESELTNLDKDFDGFYSQYGHSELLEEVLSRRERKSGLAYPRNLDFAELIPQGEGQTIEFKEGFPTQADDLGKELAAFGTTNPGVILLGVADDGTIVGLDGIATADGLDKLKTRIEGISSNGINPSLLVRIRKIKIKKKNIAVVEVPKGPEAVYYTKSGVPYIRHGSMSRPALPQEVNELVKRYLERN